MNVHVNDALAKRLNDLAAASGRKPDELIQDALVGYLDELTELRQRLDARYDDLKAGRVQPVGSDEAAARLREKSQLRKLPPA
jgi:predicted transcriptional regulator